MQGGSDGGRGLGRPAGCRNVRIVATPARGPRDDRSRDRAAPPFPDLRADSADGAPRAEPGDGYSADRTASRERPSSLTGHEATFVRLEADIGDDRCLRWK